MYLNLQLLFWHGFTGELFQCMTEGLGVVFQQPPPSSANSVQKDEVYAQVCCLLLFCVLYFCELHFEIAFSSY